MTHPRTRGFGMLALVAVLWAMLAPADAHITKKVGHTWKHIQARADVRYPTKASLTTADAALNEPGDPVHWTRLTGVPAGFADGTDEDGGTATDLDCTGCVNTDDVAAGEITQAKLSFDPATQGELDTHASSDAHDGRYYTESEADAAFASVTHHHDSAYSAAGHDHDGSYFTKSELQDAGTLNDGDNPVDWTKLKGVPPDIADGDDTAGTAWLLTGNAATTAGTDALGTTDDEPLEIIVDGARAYRIEPASTPNMIGGYHANTVTTGVLGATISGGGDGSDRYNSVSNDFGTVGGGEDNSASGSAATIGGGSGNNASGLSSVVSGGNTNAASGLYTAVAGGNQNSAWNQGAFVGGGFSNSANGHYSAIAGGNSNSAGSSYSTIGGGRNNSTGELYATVAGGHGNAATDDNATVGGGGSNTASSQFATVGGGSLNTAGTNDYGTVGGGLGNSATGSRAAIGGGSQNAASGFAATVGGGSMNSASGGRATVAGGEVNTASNTYASVGGGSLNDATGEWATVVGGRDNDAGGDYSLAAGRRAKIDAAHDGSFLLADSTDADLPSTAANQLRIRVSGGAAIYSKSDLTTGVTLAANDGAWASVSDRNVKASFAPVDGEDVLRRVVQMPVTTWRYEGQQEIRHMGPVAQDFHAAFGLGVDDRHISTIDADGVALAAIQGLHDIVTEQEAQIEALSGRLASRPAASGIPIGLLVLCSLALLVLGAGFGLAGASRLYRNAPHSAVP